MPWPEKNIGVARVRIYFSKKYKLESNIQIDSTFAQIELIKSGAGIGRVPEFFIRDELASGEIIELFPELEKPQAHLYLLYLSTPVLPRKTQILIEFAAAYLKKSIYEVTKYHLSRILKLSGRIISVFK